jgi:hypothetical protein
MLLVATANECCRIERPGLKCLVPAFSACWLIFVADSGVAVPFGEAKTLLGYGGLEGTRPTDAMRLTAT